MFDHEHDKRAYLRTKLSEPVQYQLSETGLENGSVCADISEGGLRIKLNNFIPVGKNIRLQIHLPQGHSVECIGKVVWIKQERYSERFQAGISFENPEYKYGEGRHQVRNYINRVIQSN